MRLFGAISAWFDRDWEQRSYNPVFAFGQRFLWSAPFFAIVLAGYLFGAEPGDVLYDWGLPIGAALTLPMMAWSFYCWFLGYGRSGWQEKQARKQRATERE